MINYIVGTLSWAGVDSIILENNGIGYQIRVPASTLDRLPGVGHEVKIYTYLHVREDLLQLFGFLTMDDLEVFKLLITVNGIGPKGGLAILSIMTPDDLRFAVMADDAKSISKAPGVGAKTASKLILELKDKLKIKDVVEDALSHGVDEAAVAGTREDPNYAQMIADTVEALTALGYRAGDAMKAARNVEHTPDMTVEIMLKQSLKYM